MKRCIVILLVVLITIPLGYYIISLKSVEYFSLKLEYTHDEMGLGERLSYAVRDSVVVNRTCYILTVYLWCGSRAYDVGEMFIDLALDNVTIASFSVHKHSIAHYYDHETIVFSEPLYVSEGSVLTLSCSAVSIIMLKPHFVVKVLCRSA